MSMDILNDQFDLLLDAPESVPKLRELILDLAVRGKLVPQDPSDEPTSELLKRIEQEKQRLYKEGKIRKQKELPAVKDVEKLFGLPPGWKWARFGNIAEIERGGSPRPIKSYLTNEEDGLNWIKIGDTEIGGKYIKSAKEKIRKEGLSKTRMVHPGDFLLTNSMSFGRPYITLIEGCIHDGWLRISPPNNLDKNYLYHLLSSSFVGDFFEAAAAGAVVQNLNVSKVRRLPIPLPPFAEQQRIVAKVDELMRLCDQLEAQQAERRTARVHLNNAALNALETAEDNNLPHRWQFVHDHFDLLYADPKNVQKLREAVLQLAVRGKLVPQDPSDEPASELLERIKQEKQRLYKEGKIRKPKKLPAVKNEEKPFELPQGWGWARLADITQLSIGKTPSTKNKSYWGGDIPWVSISDMEHYGTVLDTKRSITPKAADGVFSGAIVPRGTLLMSFKLTIGKVAWLGVDAYHNEAIVSISPYRGLLDSYLFRLLPTLSTGGKTRAAIKGKTLNKSSLSNLLIPVPPSEEQQRIVAKVDELMRLCDDLEASLQAAEGRAERLLKAVLREVLHPSPDIDRAAA